MLHRKPNIKVVVYLFQQSRQNVGSFRIKRVIRYSESRLLFGSRLADDFRVTYFLACIAQLNEYMK